MLNEQSEIRKMRWHDQLLMVLSSHLVLPVIVGVIFGIVLGIVSAAQGASPEEVELAILEYDVLITGIGTIASILFPCMLIYFK